jgi:hypothetical protein
MFDVFYWGTKPGLFAFEQPADNLDHAATLSRTGHYWYIYGDNDYTGFDFDYQPAPWESQHIHVWPSQWQRNGGVYLANQNTVHCREWHFRTEQQVRRRPNRDLWIIPSNTDVTAFDFSWHPDPLEPDYEYHFPTQHQPAGGPVYQGSAGIKLSQDQTARAVQLMEHWHVPLNIDSAQFDFSWHPNPLDPAYIYQFATQWYEEGGPVYTVTGATEVKYMDEPRSQINSSRDNWTILHPIIEDRFDWSWRPHPKDPPYTYVFGNQWHSPERMPTVEYHVPGATERKYMSMVATLAPDKTHWKCLEHIQGFDYSWVPDPLEPPYRYVFGNQHWPATIMPTLTYTVPGATQEKFVDAPAARLAGGMENWKIFEDIDHDLWDWTWRPNPRDPPYTYVFGNQWNPPEYKVSVQYEVEGATERKYMESRTQRLPQPEQFKNKLPIDQFDYSWEPNPFDPPFTYVFGNQWNQASLEPTVEYHVPGATEIKYIDDLVATVAPLMTNWEILDDVKQFDYSWRPNPFDPPYRYVFGNQWMAPEQRPAVCYVAPGAEEIKYMDEPKAQRHGDPDRFDTHYDCEFDYSWEPDPGSPPYRYVFGNQWYPAEIMPTVEYAVAGATERKFMSEPRARLLPSSGNWITHCVADFDYSWQPEPKSPLYIFVFGNQHWPAQKMPTVEYHMPGATERKYMDRPRAVLVPDKQLWGIPEEVDENNIDFSWVPDPGNPPYIYHFGTEFQMSVGLTYTVPGATEPKFEGEIPRLVKEHAAIDVLDIFFIDRNNATAQSRFDRLKNLYPKIQKVRFANDMMATIQRCITKARTSKFWVISSEYNYDQFDFTWHAEPWQGYMTHVFPSQHQKWSDTYLINKWEFERHSTWAKSLEEFPNLNFVKDQTVNKSENRYNIYYVDHGNQVSQHQYDYLRSDVVTDVDIIKTRFVDSYLETFKRIMSTAETEYVWIINSICDYTCGFDFTWEPEPWQREMIHVFPSDAQKRGDTFRIHVESFKQQMIELELLDWFRVINYVEDHAVPRFSIPVHYYESDDLVTEIKNYQFQTPYVLFTNQKDIQIESSECLWSPQDRAVARCSRSGATVLVPRDIKVDLKSQIYDYPYIKDSVYRINDYFINKFHPGLDIVYISNGEPDELRWYEHLCYMSNTTDIEWVRGVNGRTAAYQEAARRSRTPWFFAVFAKLEVLGNEFPWFDWMPDYFQEPKHYIFNSRNPVNGLEYGHQGVIAYNKRLVLENNAPGIDFTLSQPHESVPILSGVAHFNQDAWMTWRTAFREVVKLKHFMAVEPTVETEHRLNTWLTVAEGNYAEYCLAGARDAVGYYNEVAGDYELLKLSFDWAWLKQRFDNK